MGGLQSTSGRFMFIRNDRSFVVGPMYERMYPHSRKDRAGVIFDVVGRKLTSPGACGTIS